MEHEHHLIGGCHCGRNRYVVQIPERPSDLTVFLDNSHASRLAHAAPLAVFLRVPITLYHSTTLAYYDDETHNDIRKTYQPGHGGSVHPSQKPTRRQFCGFCGTQLSSWSEEWPGEGEYIAVTLGSMRDRDVERLHDMGVLPSDEEEGEAEDDGSAGTPRGAPETSAVSASNGSGLKSGMDTRPTDITTSSGAPWFESMVQDSPLGRIRKQKGGHMSNDGRTKIEWEVVEIDGSGTTFSTSSSSTRTATTTTESTASPGKRKLEETVPEGQAHSVRSRNG